MTVAAADYTTAIELCRTYISRGVGPKNDEVRFVLGVLKDAATKLAADKDAVEELRTVWDAQIAILQAGGAGDISAEVDAAQTAIEAKVAALETATTIDPSYYTNTVMDG